MTTTATEPRIDGQKTKTPSRKGSLIVSWMTSTDHKTIGYLYLITSFAFFLFGGVLAVLMRLELLTPGMQFMSHEQFIQMFTMHGTIMMLMFATLLFVGFSIVIMRLMICTPVVDALRLIHHSYFQIL